MNFSITNEVVWLAPERCATQITKKIFEKYDFYSISKKYEFEPKNFLNVRHSHLNIIKEEYENYKIILNTRNPYDFVFSIFANKYYSKPITKEIEGLKESFSNWIKKSFLNHGNYVFLCPFYNHEGSFFKKWRFNEDFTPHFVIRSENLYVDLLNLPFIQSETQDFKDGMKILIEDNGFINKRYLEYRDLYGFVEAKLIYNFFKTSFEKFGYSPFSFSKTELTDMEKSEFINSDLD
jgi:hypothetical protein